MGDPEFSSLHRGGSAPSSCRERKKYKNKEINTLSLVNIMAWDIFRHLVLYFTFCINWASHSEGVELVTSSGNIASYITKQLT